MSDPITNQDVWLSSLLFGSFELILLLPLLFSFKRELFSTSGQTIAIASAIFWGILAVFLMFRYWDLFYSHFYPSWLRGLAPLSLLLYGVLGLGLWRLVKHNSIPAILSFVVFGGMEGIAEHIIAIYGFRILEKVPLLQGLDTFPILIFSFFEYMAYWTLVAWLALGITKLR
jgi:hypothetical protein